MADQGSGVRDQGLGAAPEGLGVRGQDTASRRQPLPNPDSPIFTSFGNALLRQMQQSIATTTRTISYQYDGLQRLTSASENPGTTQTYSYDLAGNRTGVWVNGTRTQQYTYNAANQVTGWNYDAAGNLLSDGSQSYTYDALGRVLSVGSTTNQYNADGTLVAQTANSVTTRYTQDLAAPLSQILSDSTQRYVYGNPAERLFAQQGSSTRTWYSTDALGSVRATLNDAGVPQGTASYDAWGVPETPLIGSFGFTGELQRGSDVWLRARWYGAGRGTFGGRDAWAGDAQTPYSMQYYQYGYSNPVSNRDPSGRVVSGTSVPVTYSTNAEPSPIVPHLNMDCPADQDTITLSFTDLGIIVGSSMSVNEVLDTSFGRELVYDLLSFETSEFFIGSSLATPIKAYDGTKIDSTIGFNLNIIGAGGGYYVGGFTGLSTYPDWSVLHYGGYSYYGGFSLQTPFDIVSIDSIVFKSADGHLWGGVTGMSIGMSIWPYPISARGGMLYADPVPGTFYQYRYPNFSSYPTWQDGQNMVQDMQDDLLLLSPLIYVRARMVVEANAKEWQKLEDWRQSHPGVIVRHQN